MRTAALSFLARHLLNLGLLLLVGRIFVRAFGTLLVPVFAIRLVGILFLVLGEFVVSIFSHILLRVRATCRNVRRRRLIRRPRSFVRALTLAQGRRRRLKAERSRASLRTNTRAALGVNDRARSAKAARGIIRKRLTYQTAN
ncbi:MAG: hypothetical protein DI565_11715 [Ancylobacter novellus]|uniref:Uncharacterized protein n=1 Tax=Ancylobacter novellus TaxID=921 RepID=A0A2W5KDX3_ANCNO|nr:MAG: hypothetical protein DI565_11715 [Ancylobacter novellus]